MRPRLSQIAQSGALTGQVATWDGTQWSPAGAVGERLVEDGITPPVDLTLENGTDYLYVG